MVFSRGVEMGSAPFSWGNLFYLLFAILPLVVSRGVALPTLVGVVAGSALAYRKEVLPKEIRLMIPGFIAGMFGSVLADIVAYRFGFGSRVSGKQALWWSAWFAFFGASLIQSFVLTVRMKQRARQK
jgi:hypothetical protein